MSEGAHRIAAERLRQIDEEDYTDAHDDAHDGGELAMAACCYAAPERIYKQRETARAVQFLDPWPWSAGDDKRPHSCHHAHYSVTHKLRLLTKAGALIAAEIDRLLRVADASRGEGLAP